MMRFALLCLVFLLPVAAFAGTEDLQPNGDQSLDVNFDTCSNSEGSNCWGDVNEGYSAGCGSDPDANTVTYDNCTASNIDARDRFNLTNPVTEAGNSLSGTQTVEVCALKCDSGQSGTPTMTIEVYCSGDADGSPQTSGTATNLGNSSTAVSHSFDASALSCASNPDNVEVAVFCDGVGGSPGARVGCTLDLIEFQGNFAEASTRRVIQVH
jgi:hypothetical protein